MRRVITVFDVQGSERVRASLGQMQGGFQQTRYSMRGMNNDAGLLDKQLRALGTTIRYAFSGAAVYGTMQMVRNMGEFESKLGDISAIATGPGNVSIVGDQLDDLGDRLLKVSNDTAQPISDLQDGVVNLYSTIGNIPENKAADLIRTIAEVAVTSQSNIQDTTQALLGMANAFGESSDAVGKFGDEFQVVIRESAGMPGSIYAQKLGVLSSRASLAGFTPEQMGALAIGATRSGGSPNTNMQYLAQFIQSLFFPQTKKNEAEMASLGLGEAQRKNMPAWEVLMRYFQAVEKAGGLKGTNNRNLNQAFSALNENDASQAALGAFGITGGGSDIINKSFGRLQSRTMAAILYKVFSSTQTKGTENKTLDEYLKEVQNSAGSVDKAMERAMERKRIVQAGNAIHNLGIEIGVAFGPILNPSAKGITYLIDQFSSQNHYAQMGEATGLIAGGALAVRALRNRGVSRVPVGPISAASDLLTETGRGSTPLKPLYVAVVYSLAGGLGGFGVPRRGGSIPGSGIPNKDLRTAGEEAGNAERTASRASRLARLGGKLAPLAGLTRLAGGPISIAALEFFGGSDGGQSPTPNGLPWIPGSPEYDLYVAGLKGRMPNARGQLTMPGGGISNDVTHDPAYIRGLKQYEKSLNTDQLKKMQTTLDAISGGVNRPTQLTGKATVDVNVKDAAGKTMQKKSVTLDLFPDFTPFAPTQRAKSKSQRGG